MRRSTNCRGTTIRRLCCLALVLLSWHATALGACLVQRRAIVPLLDLQNHLLVPVRVNGIAGWFVLDTGAERSMVTLQAVPRLHLALDHWVDTTMQGVGGVVEHRNADPRSLSLGGVALHRRTITHDTSLTVGAMRLTEIGGHRIDGLLGRDFLSLFDLELDPAHGRLTLYDVHGCAGPFLPWTNPYVEIHTQQPTGTAMVLPVRLDGVALRALLDTGASASVLTAPGMVRLGLTRFRVARDRQGQAHGIGPHTTRMWLHRFASMQVGAGLVEKPLIWVAPIRVVPIVDMLLGADWLSGKVVWISFATKQVFVSIK